MMKTMMLMMMRFHYLIMELMNNRDSLVQIIANCLDKYYIDQMIEWDDRVDFHLLLLSMVWMVKFANCQYRIVHRNLLEYLLVLMLMR